MIEFDRLLFIAYEDYFFILARIIFENMRESPIVCKGFDPNDYSSQKIWQHLGIKGGEVLLTGFSRDNLTSKGEHYHKPNWSKINKDSLLAVSVEGLLVDFLLKESGGGKKFVKAKVINIYDYRLNSKLKLQNKVLFSSEAHKVRTSKSGPWEPIKKKDKDSLSHMFQDEKIEKINQVKLDMFNKYFSKDDFMNSIQSLIYTEKRVRPEAKTRKMRYFMDVHEFDKEEMTENEIRLRKRRKKKEGCFKCWRSLLNCCKKKRKTQATQSEEKQTGPVDAISGINCTAKAIHTISKAFDEESPEKKTTSAPGPIPNKLSHALMDKFTRAEVPWVIHTLEETRVFHDIQGANFSSSVPDSESQIYDLTLEMENNWQGESCITINIKDKTMLFLQDFLWAALEFFKKPFANGPQYSSTKPEERWNNYGPMAIHIFFDRLKIVLPSSLEVDGEVSIQCDTNLYLKFQYQGDAGHGPGYFDMLIELDLKQCYEKQFFVVKASDLVVKEKDASKSPEHDPALRSKSLNKKKSKKKEKDGQKDGASPTDSKQRSTSENFGNIMENITILYQQKFETKFWRVSSPDEKQDSFKKVP